MDRFTATITHRYLQGSLTRRLGISYRLFDCCLASIDNCLADSLLPPVLWSWVCQYACEGGAYSQIGIVKRADCTAAFGYVIAEDKERL